MEKNESKLSNQFNDQKSFTVESVSIPEVEIGKIEVFPSTDLFDLPYRDRDFELDLHAAFEASTQNICEDCQSYIVVEHAWNPSFIISAIFVLFLVGLFGFVFNRSHILLTIISGEIMLLASYLNFVHAGYAQADPKGNIYAVLILVIAASESAIGLALIVKLQRLGRTAMISSMRFLRG